VHLFFKRFRYPSAILTFCILTASDCFAFEKPFQVYSLLRNVEGKFISKQSLLSLEKKLKEVGFDQSTNFSGFKYSLNPVVSFEDNFNGGNPKKTLEIGGMQFVSDPAYFKQEDLGIGSEIILSARNVYGRGKYFDLSYNLSGQYGVKTGDNIFTSNARLCSNNHIYDWVYLNICSQKTILKKNLTENKEIGQSISASKFFSSKPNITHSVSTEISSVNFYSFEQKQISLMWSVNKSLVDVGSFRLHLGESVSSQHALKQGVSLEFFVPIQGKRVQVKTSQKKYDGGMLLGVSRRERITTVNTSFSLSKNFNLQLGVEKINSNIDYYDIINPTLKFRVNF